jgi:superfamily II DNA/RNA helicase
MTFLELRFNTRINKALDENTYTNPTVIQNKVIPLVLQNNDIMVKAQTGSGKTASFVLPILQLFLDKEEYKVNKVKAKMKHLLKKMKNC